MFLLVLFYPHLNPVGTFLPQPVMMALNETWMFKLIPSTFAFMAVHRHTATSKSVKPSSKAQHSLSGGVPIITFTTPSRFAHTPSFSVSRGQKGLAGGLFWMGLGFGFGFGIIGSVLGGHSAELVVKKANRRREKIETVAEILEVAMTASESGKD